VYSLSVLLGPVSYRGEHVQAVPGSKVVSAIVLLAYSLFSCMEPWLSYIGFQEGYAYAYAPRRAESSDSVYLQMQPLLS
jgi:hypothetical protein